MRSFGPYEVIGRLGAGGFGAVYEVRHRETGGAYALKALLPLHDQEERRRFEREAEAMGRLDHPHVARVHAADLSGPEPYLVQELLRGGDLSGLLQRGPLSVERALALTRQVARGLAHAHAAGVLHRDLKPGNVLLDEEGQAKLVDFGLARVSGRSRLTETHSVMGTPAYMSPEQARGEALDERSDVYSLGALLYALLTGQPPFQSRGNVLALLAAINTEAPRSPRTLRPALPAWLEELCLRALAKDPAARFPSAEAFAEALVAGAPPGVRGRSVLGLALGAALCALLAGGYVAAGSRPGAGSPSRSPSVAAASPQASSPAAERRRDFSRARRWDRRLSLSADSCGAWWDGHDLLVLDWGGVAARQRLDRLGRPTQRTILARFPRQERAPSVEHHRPLALWRSERGWASAYLYRSVLLSQGEASERLDDDWVRFCKPRGASALWCLGERPYELWRWTAAGAEKLFEVPGPRDESEQDRLVIDGAARLPGGDELVCWSHWETYRWRPGERPRLLESRREEHGQPYGKNRFLAISPDGERLALASHLSLLRYGRLDEPPKTWVQLPDPPGSEVAFAHRELVFAGDDLLVSVGGAQGPVTELRSWDLSGDSPRPHGARRWQGALPTGLSLAPGGDVLAVGLTTGEVLLVGVERLKK